MTPKLAIKQLTASDLTIFAGRFTKLAIKGRKSITLSANVFVDRLFPAIGVATRQSGGVLVDLWIYGPDNPRALNLQRKIIRGRPYRNWKLDGELIANPIDDPTRFNSLMPGDYAIFSFEGDVVPSQVTIVFVAKSLPEDAQLHAVLDGLGMSGRDTMRVLDESAIADIAARALLSENHPLISFTITDDLQEAAIGGAAATERLLRRARPPNVSAEALRRAREQADEIGRLGEALIAIYLARQKRAGAIADYEWVSEANAVAPMDFRLSPLADGPERIDVKTTSGPFERDFHASLAELKEMAADSDGPYRIYRVYEATENGAKLRISAEMKGFALSVLASLAGLPGGVVIDAVSIDPGVVSFDQEIALTSAEDDDDA